MPIGLPGTFYDRQWRGEYLAQVLDDDGWRLRPTEWEMPIGFSSPAGDPLSEAQNWGTVVGYNLSVQSYLSNVSWPRICDLLARTAMGPGFKSRLFLAPPRETLMAADPLSFQTLHARATGVKASLPMRGIVP